MKNFKATNGFTLIELMIVVGILSVIAAIAIPAYQHYVKNAYLAECLNEVAAIELAQNEFFLENNAFFPDPAATVNGVANIENASGGLYVSGYTVANDNTNAQSIANVAAANCTYSLTSTAAPSWSITVTGQNNLEATDTFTKTN